MSNRSWYSPFKDLVDSIRGLKTATEDLKEGFRERKLLKSDTPEAREYVLALLKSEEGEFIANSGVLTKEEIATLSPAQLADWLKVNTALLKISGKETFTQMVPEVREQWVKKFRI